MATQAQVHANQANSQKSTGPTSESGKENSSHNRFLHGLSDPGNVFLLQAYEDEAQFTALEDRLHTDLQPQGELESILVRRMVESEWLRLRAIRLQNLCQDTKTGYLQQEKHFALYLRYQTTHERGFYKAFNELQKLRSEKRKQEIGFESQKRQQASEQRAAEVHNLKKEAHNFQKQELQLQKQQAVQPVQPATFQQPAEASPGDLKMAA